LATVARCQAGNDRARAARLGLASPPEEAPPTDLQPDSNSPLEDGLAQAPASDGEEEPPSPAPPMSSSPASVLPERAPQLWQCTTMGGHAAPASFMHRIEALRETWLSHQLSLSQGHHPTGYDLASHSIMALQ